MGKVGRARSPQIKTALNAEALYRAITARRAALGISQLAVAKAVGFNYEQFLLRIRQGIVPSTGTFLALMSWLGETDITPYTNLEPHPMSRLRRSRLGVLVPVSPVDSSLRTAARVQNALVDKIAEAIWDQAERDTSAVKYVNAVLNFKIPEDDGDSAT